MADIFANSSRIQENLPIDNVDNMAKMAATSPQTQTQIALISTSCRVGGLYETNKENINKQKKNRCKF